MNYTKAHIVTLAAGICFAHGSIRATEQPRPNKFKVAAAIALASVAGKAAMDHMPVDTLLGTSRSFAVSATTCGLLTVGASAGAYIGSYATHNNEAGVIGGSVFGARIALTPVVASDITGGFMSNVPTTEGTTLESAARAVGCYCGGQMGVAVVHAALSQ